MVRWLPTGRSLDEKAWRTRHRGVLALLAVHAPALFAFGLWRGFEVSHALLEAGVVAVFAVAAAWPRLGRRAGGVVASLGIMSASAILVHFSGGYIEAHFHFFVMLGVVFLYEDWVPYSLAVAYVAIHHGVAGSIDPASVFNHPAAMTDPWLWAGIHATFILGLSASLLVAWNVVERARRSEASAFQESRVLRAQMSAQERMAALGSLTAGLAHEIRTPLTVVATNAALLEIRLRRAAAEERPAPGDLLERVSEIHRSVERINALITQLRRFGRLSESERRVTPLGPVVQEAVDLFESAHRAEREIHVEIGPTPAANVHELAVEQVVLNLLMNAVEATKPGGRIVVRTYTQGTHACLSIEDDGSGMAEEVQRHLFEPLFTTKPDGTGLGLSIVKRIVDAHGAAIECDTAPGRGTRFVLTFPPASATAAEPPPASARAANVPPAAPS